MYAQPTYLSSSTISGKRLFTFPNPTPIKSNSDINPNVAPLTNFNEFLNPKFRPLVIAMIFTGPGLIDIEIEKITIGKNKDIALLALINTASVYILQLILLDALIKIDNSKFWNNFD